MVPQLVNSVRRGSLIPPNDAYDLPLTDLPGLMTSAFGSSETTGKVQANSIFIKG